MDRLPPPYAQQEAPLSNEFFLALRPQILQFDQGLAIGTATLKGLEQKLQTLYHVQAGVCKPKRPSDAGKDMVRLFHKLFRINELCDMENYHWLTQVVVSPPTAKQVDLDLLQFYRKRRFESREWYAAKFILEQDIIELKRIREITIEELRTAWDVDPQSWTS